LIFVAGYYTGCGSMPFLLQSGLRLNRLLKISMRETDRVELAFRPAPPRAFCHPDRGACPELAEGICGSSRGAATQAAQPALYFVARKNR
jgi:hypothetical protein